MVLLRIAKKIFLIAVVSLVLLFFTYPLGVVKKKALITDFTKCFQVAYSGRKVCPQSSTYTKLNRLPNHLVQSIVLSEDAAFYSHNGLDWYELLQSMKRNLREMRIARGGSTITQQLIKNLYLKHEKSIVRKIDEAILARDLEKKLSKEQILEIYLNIIEYAPDVFGISEATQFYFAKQPESLSLLESTYLAQTLPNPSLYAKKFLQGGQLSEENKERMGRVLNLLDRFKKVDADDIKKAKETLGVL